MNFYDKIRYIRWFQQVIQKGGEPAIKYIKIFRNTKVLEISVGNGYSEEKNTLLIQKSITQN